MVIYKIEHDNDLKVVQIDGNVSCRSRSWLDVGESTHLMEMYCCPDLWTSGESEGHFNGSTSAFPLQLSCSSPNIGSICKPRTLPDHIAHMVSLTSSWHHHLTSPSGRPSKEAVLFSDQMAWL